MKKIVFLVLSIVLSIGAFAQTKGDNKVAKSILGEYEAVQGSDHFKARITQNADGTFKGQVYWLEKDKDENGAKTLDVKNSDKNRSKLPADQVVLFDGLQYNSKKSRWDGTKIYDPQRGLKANMEAKFQDDGKLMIEGSVLFISEKVYWTKIK